jgi:microcystin-dependent protein
VSDIGSSNYSETAASNNAVPPAGWPEGMNPSDVNNSARENMAGTKRFWNRANSTHTTDAGGTNTAYTLTYDVAESAYYAGEEFSFVVDKTCGAAPTLNINSLGSQNLRKFSGGAYVTLAAGDLLAAQPIRVRNSGTTFDIIGMAADIGISVPTGTVFPYAGASAPAGYLLCFGQAVSRTTFAALFAICSTTYGSGDGSTTFNVPDLRGMVAGGKTDMGGSDRGNLSGGTVLGAALGTQSVSSGGPGSEVPVSNTSTNVNVGADGHTHSVTVVQPTFILNSIIKT